MHGSLKHGFAALALFALGAAWTAGPVRAQEEPFVVERTVRSDHSPRGALWRAAALPGWGQLYNEQYFKAPIVWGGIVGLAGGALYVNYRYRLYRHAWFWAIRDDENVGIDVPARWEDDYLEIIDELGLTPEQAAQRQNTLAPLFKRNRDYLRRNRDLLYIGVGLFYGLSILDAYVSAHLLDFDVSEDLSLSIQPVHDGLAARLRYRP